MSRPFFEALSQARRITSSVQPSRDVRFRCSRTRLQTAIADRGAVSSPSRDSSGYSCFRTSSHTSARRSVSARIRSATAWMILALAATVALRQPA